jgi:hypothetical protein
MIINPGLPGTNGTLNATGDGTTLVADGHGRYMNAALRGNTFSVADTGFHTMPAGLSASPINVSLYNPVGNTKNAVIYWANMVEGVAWPAAAIVWLATYYSPTPTTGTALASTNVATGAASTSTVKPLTTATLNAAPIAALILGVGLTGAITVTTQGASVGGFLDGVFILAPGGTAVIASSTVSGTTGAAVSWIWEEIALNM